MLFQLHWQNVMEPSRTEFVAQDSGETELERVGALERLARLASRRRSECPEGWVPVYCNELSERFMWAVDPPQGQV